MERTFETIPDNMRVVITGLGAVTPAGITIPEFWASITSGQSSIRTLTHPSIEEITIGGEVIGFVSDFLNPKVARRNPTFENYGAGASFQAVLDAQCVKENDKPGRDDLTKYKLKDGIDPRRIGVITSVAVGVTEPIATAERARIQNGEVADNTLIRCDINRATSIPAQIIGAQGEEFTLNQACSGGLKVIIEAYWKIRTGRRDIMLVVGAEDPLDPVFMGAYRGMKLLSKNNENPGQACEPYAVEPTGIVIGAGAGAMVIESLESARRRGVLPYVEILGVGETCRPFDGLQPTREGYATALREALDIARIPASKIDYVNGHGPGSGHDNKETDALREICGAHIRQLRLSSIKATIGHLQGATALVESIATVLAILYDTAPPTLNSKNPSDKEFNYVPNEAEHFPISIAAKISSGLQGVYTAAIFGELPQSRKQVLAAA